MLSFIIQRGVRSVLPRTGNQQTSAAALIIPPRAPGSPGLHIDGRTLAHTFIDVATDQPFPPGASGWALAAGEILMPPGTDARLSAESDRQERLPHAMRTPSARVACATRLIGYHDRSLTDPARTDALRGRFNRGDARL